MTATGWDFPGPLRLDSPQLLAALRADLTAADFTVDAVEQLIGATAYAELSREQLAPGRLALHRANAAAGGATPLSTMTAWWLFAMPQAPAALAAAFPSLGLDGLQRLGLLNTAPPSAASEDSAPLRPAVDLRPHAGDDIGSVWIASDLGTHQLGGALSQDFVLGVGQASLTLAQSIIRRSARRALDLGTGCGIQLLHLLPHCEHVTATDISVRALNVTAFNLLLNAETLRLFDDAGAARVTLLAGSLLEPVSGVEFDLIVSNPPFVITPRTADETPEEQYTYRDGGMTGDSLVEALVRALPSALAPGGIAQMLGNWEVPADAAWDERPRSWVSEGTDAWFIQREQVDTTRYALTWLNDASQSWEPQALDTALAQYEADFASRGVESVGFGMILLSRPAAPEDAWVGGSVFEEITHPIEQPIGPHLGAALDRRLRRAHAAASSSSSSLHLAVAEDVTEERHQRPGAEHPGVILARQGAGLRRTALLTSEQAGFLSAADGELSVGQIAGALAAILENETLPETLIPEVFTLFEEGFLHEDNHPGVL
jgi:hypothetical protein